MFIKGTLKEFSGHVGDFKVYENALFFCEQNRVWKSFDLSNFQVFTEGCCDHFEGLGFIENKLWVTECIDVNCEQTVYVCHDGKNPDERRRDAFPYPSAVDLNEVIFSKNWEDEECFFYTKQKRTGEVTKKKTECYRVLLDESGIYSKSAFGKIEKLDYELNIAWQKEYDKKNDIRAKSTPQIYDDIVICNIGADPKTKENGKIVAYQKDNGKEIWRRSFEKEPANCQLFGDLLYMAHQSRMVVLEAATGRTVVDEPSGFETRTVSEILVPLDDHLVMISKEKCAIRLFSGDGKKLIQHLDIPGGYETHDGGPLIIHDGQIFLRTYPSDMCLKGVKEALLVLEKAQEGQSCEIEIEEWPVSVAVDRKADDGGECFYTIDMQGTSLQDLLIYSEIALEELPSIYGAQIWSDDRRDFEFNGKILFRPSGIEWNEDARRKLIERVRYVEKWCVNYDICSGDAKNPISIEVEFKDNP